MGDIVLLSQENNGLMSGFNYFRISASSHFHLFGFLSLPFIGYKSEVTSIVSCTLCPILLLRLRMQLCSLPCSREVGLDGMEVQS